jgi:Uma2 family endonuclease
LKGKNCTVFNSDLRVSVNLNSLFTYPDITIVCGEIEKVDGIFDTITNPTVIVEVLSESTKDYDRGSKFMLYRGLANLREYVLIDSTGYTHIEKFYKDVNGWMLSECTLLSETVRFQSLGIEVQMSDIYQGVY